FHSPFSSTLHTSLPLAHSPLQSPKTNTYFSSVSLSTHGTLFLSSPTSHVKLVSFSYILLFWVIAEMDATISPGLYPLHRCKTLHLVRHAQGVHNVAGEIDHAAYSSEEYFDAHLTPLGWQQVDHLRNHVHETGLSKKVDLVIVSPLLRTMQTAVGVFGGEGYKDGIEVPPLMVANAGQSDRPEISSLNCPPFVAVELCREHMVCPAT
ncbi:hypothetical protein Golob_010873, partial [Gossypium lobatum]|nr:hypothetical protein [Gossypium lobatum]